MKNIELLHYWILKTYIDMYIEFILLKITPKDAFYSSY